MHYYNKIFLCLNLVLFSQVSIAGPVVIDQVVASIDGKAILQSELTKEKESVAKVLALEKRESEMEQPFTFEKRVLEQMIENIILEKEIKRLGLEATDAQVEQVLGNLMKGYQIKSKEDFKQVIQSQGQSFSEYEENFRKRISRDNFIRQTIRPKIDITKEDIQRAYLQNSGDEEKKKRFFEFSMVFVPLSEMTSDTFANHTKKITNAADFESFAKKHSRGPMSEKGGYMGKVNQEDLNKAIEKQLMRMKKGDISDTIKTENGYILVRKIDEGYQNDTLDDEQKALITEQIFNTRVTKALNQTLARLKQNAIIEKFI